MAAWLASNGYANTLLGTRSTPGGVNEGQPGYRVQAIRANLAAKYGTTIPIARHVTLHTWGMNNALGIQAPYDGPADSAELLALLNDIRTADATTWIAISTITPANVNGANANVIDLNTRVFGPGGILDQFDAARPPNAPLLIRCDPYTAMQAIAGSIYTPNASDIHPSNTPGYSTMWSAIQAGYVASGLVG